MQTADDGQHGPKKVQQTDSAAFQNMSDAYEALAKSAENARDLRRSTTGKQAQQNAVKGSTPLSKGYADLKKQVDALDTKDKSSSPTGSEPRGRLDKLRQAERGSLQEPRGR